MRQMGNSRCHPESIWPFMQRVRKWPTYQVPWNIWMTWTEPKKRVRFSLSTEAQQPFLSTLSATHLGQHHNLTRLFHIEFGRYPYLPHCHLSYALSPLPISYVATTQGIWNVLSENTSCCNSVLSMCINTRVFLAATGQLVLDALVQIQCKHKTGIHIGLKRARRYSNDSRDHLFPDLSPRTCMIGPTINARHYPAVALVSD